MKQLNEYVQKDTLDDGTVRYTVSAGEQLHITDHKRCARYVTSEEVEGSLSIDWLPSMFPLDQSLDETCRKGNN